MTHSEDSFTALFDKTPVYHSQPVGSLLQRLHVPVEGAVALDLGCGDGRVCQELLTAGAQYCVGVDYSAVRIQVAQDIAKEKGLGDDRCDFRQDNWWDYVNCLIQERVRLDLVCLCNVLEHSCDPVLLLQKTARVARYLFGSVPLQDDGEGHFTVFPGVDSLLQLFSKAGSWKDTVITLSEDSTFLYFTAVSTA